MMMPSVISRYFGNLFPSFHYYQTLLKMFQKDIQNLEFHGKNSSLHGAGYPIETSFLISDMILNLAILERQTDGL